MLRDAAARESRGDYEGAEQVLRALLEESPGSSGGLFALERVLRAQGEVVSIMPAIDEFLEATPDSPGVRSLELRVLADVDSLDAVRREAEEWIALQSEREVVYREVSRVYARVFDERAALAVLSRGRDRLGDPTAFALEIGDLHAAEGDATAAAREWAAAVAPEGAQVSTLSRRLGELPGDLRGPVAEALVDELAVAATPEARAAAAALAIDLALPDRADRLVRSVADDLDARTRESFLADAARRARQAGMDELASWAYDELGARALSPAERREFDERMVEASLAAGDTASALEAQWRLVDSYSPRSVDRRRASARAVRLEAGSADSERLLELLADFRERFANAPELDDIAASVARALQARGDARGAAAVLEGVRGPRSALERAYLLLGDGAIAEGRAALLLAVTGLPPSEATGVIQFAGLLGRLSEPAAEALAAAGVAAHRGDPAGGVASLAAAEGIVDEERAAVLAAAARLADDHDEARLAADIRRELVDRYPDAPEVAEASLALARYRGRTPDGVDEAIRLLETLITARPNAAIVPDARIELQRLRQRGGSRP